MYDQRNRHYVKQLNLSTRGVKHLLALATALISEYAAGEAPHLKGKEITLVLEPGATRTRSALEIEGPGEDGHATKVDPADPPIDHEAWIADIEHVRGGPTQISIFFDSAGS